MLCRLKILLGLGCLLWFLLPLWRQDWSVEQIRLTAEAAAEPVSMADCANAGLQVTTVIKLTTSFFASLVGNIFVGSAF